MVNAQNFLNNQSITTYYFNNGKNCELSKNGISRKQFGKRTSINATKIKMHGKINYLQILKFSCKFNDFTIGKDHYSKY